MGWREVVITAAQVIVGGPSTAGTGVFVYDPTVATGNLIASITDSTTSPTGDTTLVGITSYKKGTSAHVQIINQDVNIQDEAGRSWTIAADGTSADLVILTPGGSKMFLAQAGYWVPLDPNSSVPETWHALTPSGSWANVTGEELECRLMPDNTVAVHGQLTIPTGVTGVANTITVLGAKYRPPNRNEPVTLTENLASSPFTGTTHIGLVRTNGNLDIFGAATNGNTLSVQIRYPLDGS